VKPHTPPAPASGQMNPRVYRIDPGDNVAVALVDLAASSRVPVGETTLLLMQAVPFGHKVALVDIRKGSPVIKYGEQIGLATRDIAAGHHVHIHNVESTRGRGDLSTAPDHVAV
jgi:altronate dehydratase small subunit